MEGGAILVANMLRSPRDLADHVANQFTASSGCILLNGSFCFGCLRGARQTFLFRSRHCIFVLWLEVQVSKE